MAVYVSLLEYLGLHDKEVTNYIYILLQMYVVTTLSYLKPLRVAVTFSLLSPEVKPQTTV